MSCLGCPIPAFLFWRVHPGCTGFTIEFRVGESLPKIPVLDVMSWLSYAGNPILAFLFWMSHPGCSGFTIEFRVGSLPRTLSTEE